ncbi:MAG: transposase [Verrucomicrobiales bacterium]
MKILHLVPGTGNFHCGACLRDHALVKALQKDFGHEVTMVPLYLPLVLDEAGAGDEALASMPIFLGGVNLFLQEKAGIFRHAPRWMERLLDSKALLRGAAHFAGMTSARDLGEMTLSSFRAAEGRQVKEWRKLLDWIEGEGRPDVISLSNGLLIGIAKTLISRRARIVEDHSAVLNGALIQMRDLTRARRGFVRQKTGVSNRIHALVDRLCPGFLDESKSGIGAFTEASLAVMTERFSAPEIAHRKHSTLTKMLRRNRTRNPDEAAGMLIALAQEALGPDPSRIASQQECLRASVELYGCLKHNAKIHAQESAILLAQTPYAMLTSVRGIGFVLAAGTGSELGNPKKLGSTDSLCSYCGIVPRVRQSGGPDKAPLIGSTSRRCNHILKDWVVQSSQKMALYGPPEVKSRFARWKAGGQHAAFAGARRYLRLLRTLVRNQVPYLGPEARRAGASHKVLAAASEEAFDVLVAKWRMIPDWQTIAFAEDRPLGFWRRLAIETHGAHLPLPREN